MRRAACPQGPTYCIPYVLATRTRLGRAARTAFRGYHPPLRLAGYHPPGDERVPEAYDDEGGEGGYGRTSTQYLGGGGDEYAG